MKNDEFKKEKLGLFQSQINELHAVGSIRSSKWLTMTNGQYGYSWLQFLMLYPLVN